MPSQDAVQDLQRLAGNAAIASWLQTTTPSTSVQNGIAHVQRLAKPGDIDAAVTDLHEALVLKNVVPVESVLQTLLLQKGKGVELKQKYADSKKRDLVKDLEKLGGNDAIRGQVYLEHGGLRAADKIYFTIAGWGVDLTTMETVLTQLRGSFKEAETDFSASYSSKYGNRNEKLPDGNSSTIAGAVITQMERASLSLEWHFTKAKALLAYSSLRPADRARIAVAGRFINESQMLIGALVQDPKVETIKTQYKASYGEELADNLNREMSTVFKDRDVAAALLEGNRSPAERAVKVIKICTSGVKSAPEIIWQVLGALTDFGPVKTAVEAGLRGEGELKGIKDFFGGLGEEDLNRLKAMVGIGGAGILADPLVQELQKSGGTGSGSVFDVLKMSTPPQWERFKNGYRDVRSPFNQFVSTYCVAAEKGWLDSQVFADPKARIEWTFANPGNTDYLVHIINNFTDGTTRRELSRDAAFMTKVRGQGTANANKVLMALAPPDMAPLEKAKWLNDAVGRETSSGVGSVTNAADAVADENRELQAAVARAQAAGKPLDEKQLAEIAKLAAATEGSLRAFVRYRDELEATVDAVVSAAVGLILGLATGGASVEMAVAAIARAAVASAMAKVVSKKVVMGDRFDVIGDDGAGAFVSGAVDGALNVIAGVVTAGVATGALKEAATDAARAAAPASFRTFAADTGKKMLENAVTGALSTAVEASVHNETWAQGGDRGLAHILKTSIVNAAIGAGITGAVSAVMAGLRLTERLAKIKTLPENEQRALIAEAIDKEGVGPTIHKTNRPAEELRDLVGAESPSGRRISEYLASGVNTLDAPAIRERLITIDKQPTAQRQQLVQQAIDVLGPAETVKRLPSWEMTATMLGEGPALTRLAAWRDSVVAQAQSWASHADLADPVSATRDYLAKAAGCAPAVAEAALGVTVSLVMEGGGMAQGVGVGIGGSAASIDLASAFSVVAGKKPVAQKMVQREPEPPMPPLPPLPQLAPGLAGFSGSDFELAVAEALQRGDFAGNGLPKMRVVPGIHNESGNGIDLLGVSRNGDQVTFWVIECKYVREGSSWQIQLGQTGSGTQLSNTWIRKGMEELFFGEGEAEVNRIALEKVLKQTYGRDYHPSMMSDILIDHIVNTAQRRVVVPFYAERSRLRASVAHVNMAEARHAGRAVMIVPVGVRH
ncbi:hypothetical protein H7J87_28160 [Mycolicibacterium wolinskyi]|uniref:hypothetical protein n=1 Tax=Mycolicibacterium TaxID=1866885 RepID=UPI001054460B|nr:MULTISPECIES: hypothetical protein [Mycolicibacterium]MCV7289206.1 hypothetical protein [Mycolicibacterium wolinskyi]MCV7294233.1 hypothetical protein [Mycolicibacterium goodii]